MQRKINLPKNDTEDRTELVLMLQNSQTVFLKYCGGSVTEESGNLSLEKYVLFLKWKMCSKPDFCKMTQCKDIIIYSDRTQLLTTGHNYPIHLNITDGKRAAT